MEAKPRRNQSIPAIAMGSLLAFTLAGGLAVGCSQQRESSSTSSPAATSSDTASSTAQPAQQTEVLRSGAFVDGEHPTSGTARLVKRGGRTTLELDAAFSTSTSGPDLVVALHRSSDVIGSTTPPAYPIQEGDYVVLAPLESYSGAQSYPVGEEIQTAEFASAVIWCRRFNATFGAARLVAKP